jgi:hypothetical protein
MTRNPNKAADASKAKADGGGWWDMTTNSPRTATKAAVGKMPGFDAQAAALTPSKDSAGGAKKAPAPSAKGGEEKKTQAAAKPPMVTPGKYLMRGSAPNVLILNGGTENTTKGSLKEGDVWSLGHLQGTITAVYDYRTLVTLHGASEEEVEEALKSAGGKLTPGGPKVSAPQVTKAAKPSSGEAAGKKESGDAETTPKSAAPKRNYVVTGHIQQSSLEDRWVIIGGGTLDGLKDGDVWNLGHLEGKVKAFEYRSKIFFKGVTPKEFEEAIKAYRRVAAGPPKVAAPEGPKEAAPPAGGQTVGASKDTKAPEGGVSPKNTDRQPKSAAAASLKVTRVDRNPGAYGVFYSVELGATQLEYDRVHAQTVRGVASYQGSLRNRANLENEICLQLASAMVGARSKIDGSLGSVSLSSVIGDEKLRAFASVIADAMKKDSGDTEHGPKGSKRANESLVGPARREDERSKHAENDH